MHTPRTLKTHLKKLFFFWCKCEMGNELLKSKQIEIEK